MISLTLALIIGACLLSISGWFKWQAYRAERKIANITQENQQLTAQNSQLRAEKTVAETQVKHFEVRKTHEDKSHTVKRDDIINRLQQSDDLRD